MDDMSGHPLIHSVDFELHDFIADANFDQFIDLIRGDNEDQTSGFGCDLINGLVVDNQFGPTTVGDGFDFSDAYTKTGTVPQPNYVPIGLYTSTAMAPDPNYVPLGFEEEMKGGEDDIDDDDSSGTTTTTTTTPKTKTDRSRTLISERRRRGRMKEKLYALRSLVPNITKMDKASIIGDAALYVQELQMQAKKLKAEISGLESSLARSERFKGHDNNRNKVQTANQNHPVCKKILQVDVFQVEERGFYTRIVCNTGKGVAASLYRALESLTTFNVHNSNLATALESFVLTFTLKVKESETNMNLPNLKLWVTGALLNQGFEI